ncbi:hypothetical protein JCM11251_007422 [Rhodosporidiobolus azoricus]
MPFSTLACAIAALLAFSSGTVAAPETVTWYPAPTWPTTTPSARFSTVWYKADPTTSSSRSSSTAAPFAFSTSPVYTGPIGINSRPRTFWFDTIASTGTPSEVPSNTYYYGKSVCLNATLPADFKTLPASDRYMEGIALNEDFYKKHGGLRKYCGKQVELTDPANPSSTPLVYTITRGCPSDSCHGEGVSINIHQARIARKAFGWPESKQIGTGQEVVQFRIV